MKRLSFMVFAVGVAIAEMTVAGCFDSPTWRGEPMSQSFIDSEIAAGASEERVALLQVLLRTENVARARRDSAAGRLIPQALITYDGDRTAMRRKMKAGDLSDLVRLLNFETSERDGRPFQVASLLWLNGCPDEAFDTLTRHPWLTRSLNILPLATGNTELARTLLASEQDGQPNGFHVALLDLADSPEDARRILRRFIDRLDAEVGEIAAEDQFPRFGAETLLAALERRDAPPAPDTWREYRYASLAALFSALDACSPVEGLIAEMEQLPLGRDDGWRVMLDVAAVRCWSSRR